MTTMSATYSPEDNKLRLYSLTRLPNYLYERVKAAGFRWAPQQQLFVAPMWTPEREDLLLELCEEIGDEDTSLSERAEERAERFEGYQEKRASDAERAHRVVDEITSGIPLGQPILIGHHSQRRAERDAERIENGMRKAVRMWETSQYWKARAARALKHVKYKERPDVRYRRIAGLESELRVMQARYTPDPKTPAQLRDGEKHVWCGGRGGNWRKESALPQIKERCARWEAHYRNRIEYERAMLDEAGGIAAAKFEIEKGGRVLVRGEWVVVLKVNKSAGKVVSVTTTARYGRIKAIEEVQDYRAPTAEEVEQTKKATKLPPLVNYRSEGCLEQTAAQWKVFERGQLGYATRIAATAEHGAHRQRVARHHGCLVDVFIKDAKVIERPHANGAAPVVLPRECVEPEFRPSTPKETDARAAQFAALRDQLRNGVQVVSAPQLFPTPRALAQRMADIACIRTGDCMLDPSAGSGRLLEAARAAGAITKAVEINFNLAQRLRLNFDEVRTADFLQLSPAELGTFDVILMNPPFVNAQDVQHIKHAVSFLRPGGRLVAICANGPRQREALGELVEQFGGTWDDLPAGTFESEGTSVNTALLHLQV